MVLPSKQGTLFAVASVADPVVLSSVSDFGGAVEATHAEMTSYTIPTAAQRQNDEFLSSPVSPIQTPASFNFLIFRARGTRKRG
jgi:hypothetical protein